MNDRSDPLHCGSAFRRCRWARVVVALAAVMPGLALGAGDPSKGAQVFRNCLACHSAEPGVNMTGPSLTGIFGRKAGSLESFHRYSDALKASGIVWDEKSLDAWIRNPAALVPDNEMRFPGIPDATARANLIAFLHTVSEGKTPEGFRTMAGGLPDLKQASPDVHVKTIRYCKDTYTVTTAAGRTFKFWEFNLRFKSDSSGKGPRVGEPVLVGQGMQGDRAQVVFANPGEIATFIKSECSR